MHVPIANDLVPGPKVGGLAPKPPAPTALGPIHTHFLLSATCWTLWTCKSWNMDLSDCLMYPVCPLVHIQLIGAVLLLFENFYVLVSQNLFPSAAFIGSLTAFHILNIWRGNCKMYMRFPSKIIFLPWWPYWSVLDVCFPRTGNQMIMAIKD